MMRTIHRSGSIHSAWLLFLVSAGALAALGIALYLMSDGGPAHTGRPLLVYCAGGVREPMEAAAREYEETYRVPFRIEYGGSQTLLANIELRKQGDLYVPADDYYIQLARKKQLVAEALPLAQMTPVLAVAQGNPKKIKSLDDLLTGKHKLGQANPDAAAIGKLTRDALQATGQWDALKERTLVFKPTVNDVASDVKLGAVDAGIVWDATVKQFPGLEAVPLPQLAGKRGHVMAGVLTSSTQPTAALHFARFLAARDRGLKHMEHFGFEPVAGDVWAETPELRLFAGAMLKPAVEATITAFEQREGVHVTRVYNGCGILVAQMKAGFKPDAYFACEKSFMKEVNDLFLDPVDVSSNRLVIVVQKGNPHEVKTLKDLGKPNLRVGVGHEQQCAMGVITEQTLKEGGQFDTVSKNIKVRSPTGDMLVNQLRTKSLDAVIAYISNTAGLDDIEAFSIEGIPCAVAVQPMAVGKNSPHQQLANRLLDALRSAQSKKQFESYGFKWQDEKKSNEK